MTEMDLAAAGKLSQGIGTLLAEVTAEHPMQRQDLMQALLFWPSKIGAATGCSLTEFMQVAVTAYQAHLDDCGVPS